MIEIEIRKKFDSMNEVVDYMNDIASMVNRGSTSYKSDWSLSGDYEEDCDYCEGLGKRRESEETDSGAGEIVDIECSKCGGTGKVTRTV